MKASAIATGTEERRVQGLWWKAREGWSDKLRPLSTDDFVLFTNTFVPRLFILFLYIAVPFSPRSSPFIFLSFWPLLSLTFSSMTRVLFLALARTH